MDESKTRKPVFQDYYTDEDYDDVMTQLPEIIKAAVKKAGDLLEPTVQEKKEVMEVIKDYIRSRGRKVYGGTAINEAIKTKNPDDAIYDDYTFSDIEFYSPTPVVDLVELTNLLNEKKYKYVVGSEAQHEGTYSVYVNFQLYCDISYVPTRVYNGIKTIIIDGINYVDPHFILIDQFRIMNQPLTAAEQRWEKTFKRMFKLLKYYPLEYFDKSIRIEKPTDEINSYISKIKNDFMSIKEVQESCLICGFDAYNFFIRHAIQDRTVEQMSRTAFGSNKLSNFIVNVPYLDLISVRYRDTVERLYNFLKENVVDPKELGLEEYFPLFQFTGYSVFITYKGIPIVRVYEADGFCVPNIKTTRGYMYVTYQYILMFMLISKFRAHLDKNREMYFNYGIAVSNLVTARNHFLNKRELGVINDTVFSEFRIPCVGTTINYTRVSRLRGLERYKQGKAPFRYSPEQFFSQSTEAQAKFDPSKHFFKNTSGNKIMNPKNLMFKLDENGNITHDFDKPIATTEDNIEQQRIKSDENTENTEDIVTDSISSQSNDIASEIDTITTDMSYDPELGF
ncbi:putative poly(A) polymerase catalytic subunit [Tupanvirus soda lake]|uniref:Poly(A) polymerase catalytic subunit n=2 Tax=Tupanvirus TaxID=2094720 RepID=A0AC62ABU3_9VIRU|nr:putative poly(A) polymerase catalytic subunit [Tupanvirus soda lake]QKU35113.1 putative poly(A) polymerase catalytic subunit [Tupanvirus soda lake]